MNDAKTNFGRRPGRLARLFSAALGLALAVTQPQLGLAQNSEGDEPLSCELQAIGLRNACGSDAADDLWEARSLCENIPDETEREACLDEAEVEYVENRQLCRDQLAARKDLCEELGEDRYVIELDPEDFVADPLMIGADVTPNPYFPLVPGMRWTYVGEEDGETVTVEVTNTIKMIEGVPAIVVKDIVMLTDSEETIEDTDDYFAQDLDGNVWYFGEISLNFEDGDLVDIEGSWQAGRDGAQPGIIMFADAQVGTVYRQEYLPAEAEDAGRILSVTGAGESEAASCDNDCVITEDFTPLEPGGLEQKVYAPGVGLILEVDPESGEPVLELVEFVTP
jgi:hypothetical protein